MGLAPAPQFPEKYMPRYERSYGANPGMNEGPRRFEEGITNDGDVPAGFGRGAYGDTAPYRGSSAKVNPEVQWKRADETMRQRAHQGSSSWIEAPAMLGSFSRGAFAGHGLPQYELVVQPGTRQMRRSPTVVND